MKLVLVTDAGVSVEARCDSCAHWRKSNLIYGVMPDMFCGAIKQGYSKLPLRVEAEGDNASASACLITPGEFGCAKFACKNPCTTKTPERCHPSVLLPGNRL